MTRKWKAKVVVDNLGKQPMEEDLEEEDLMDEDSPPHKDADAGRK